MSAKLEEDNKDDGIIISPFCGYHPPSELMESVASPPYDVISTDEAREICAKNNKSFLNVNKPEIQFNKTDNIDQYDDRVYKMGKTQLNNFIERKWLIQDEKPNLYIYSQKMNNHQQFGLVCEASAIQYENNLIKKHELTRKKKEDDRTKLTDIQSANVGPIFLCYKSIKEINDLISNYVINNKPYSTFIGNNPSDNVEHKLWCISDNELINKLTNYFKSYVKCAYIADGHHRIASAHRVYQKRKKELKQCNKYQGNEKFHNFLAVLFPDDQLDILGYHRVIYKKIDKDIFLKSISTNWDYKKIKIDTDDKKTEEEINSILKPCKSNDFRMYLDGGWYTLSLKQETFNKLKDDVVKSLDVSILSNYLLEPILQIKDIRNDPNISFVGGIHGLSKLKTKIDSKGYGVAFGLYHTSIQQLINVADAGKIMPPKSTWFEPKLRSGVIVRKF